MNSKEKKINFFSFKLVHKVMLIAGLLVACATAILNYLFIQNLAEPRIQQVNELADTTSIIVSELALSSFYERNQDRMLSALSHAVENVGDDEGGFLQISVILYPSGIYYASTNSDFVNKKVGQSLLKKIEENEDRSIVVEKLNYEFNDRTVPVLHFLRNISVMQQGEETRVAVTQILFDYGKILSKTRRTLFIVSGVFLICVFGFVWILYLPVTRINRLIINGFGEIGKNNFDVKLRTIDFGETGTLFAAFNKMTEHLNDFFQEKSKSKMNSVMSSIDNASGTPKEFVLRKSEVTCLCARIPLVQHTIEKKSLEEIEESINEFAEPFEAVVKEFGGQVIKLLGNKIFVIFEGINSIDNSIRTALKINQKWQMINHERKVLGREKLDFGIGLHATESVAGIVSQSSMSYTVIGKAASVADYLCSCAKPEEILASSSLMDKASGSFQHQVLSELVANELEESEQVLIITNLRYSDDDLTRRIFRANDSNSMGSHGSNSQLVDNIGYDKHVYTVTGSASHEASIPDMLEETLSSAPLESITPKKDSSPDYNELNEESSNAEKDKKTSLWDEIEKKKQ
ncbi:hypothetical protein KJ966_25900 [bacterium]|nr:hypothetical protein [bacterium]